ncbi:MAG: sugar phosphate isomerase/epimerase [Synergistaceae bacterium]|jgi:sugar phosphate isomerase/epimerase|nr:sugar phosphate isomerase/epimerase [Synergistaceae bacterium]
MSRPVTIFTGQWADLTFETVCGKMSSFGYDGLEISSWGDHLDVRRAASDPSYAAERKEILAKYGLGCWAIGAHLPGQCVASLYDPRYDGFVPEGYRGSQEKMREWAVREMKYTARAARNMGVGVVTGFVGSPIWNYWYSFPQTSQEQVASAFKETAELWNPILDVFDECGVKFALEVHPTELAFDYYSSLKILDAFGCRPAFGFNFDPSHLFWQGVNPALFLRDFSDRIYHVHMKDVAVVLDGRSGILGSHIEFGDARRGWNFRSLGHGHVNFEEIIRELNAMNYQGPLSVEWEDSGMDREFGAKEALEFVRRVDFSPSDVAFDAALKK